ncbi:MAG: DUF1349 domain-containing protein [Breznakibacter sp.]
MKNLLKILLIALFTTYGCSNESPHADDCSFSINGLVFTKSINNAKLMTDFAGQNKLVMKSGAKSDFFNTPNGKHKFSNAPMLLTPVNNKEAFTFTAKVTPYFSGTYDAGAIYIYVSNNRWQKFAFEMDERKLTRLVTVRTIGTSDDNNHDASVGPSVFMKISSNVESIGFYYSTDSINWQLTRVYGNDFPDNVWLGISSQSPIGNGITTMFESFSLNKTSVKDIRKGI